MSLVRDPRAREQHGTKNWTRVAEGMLSEYNIEGRKGKQCRERWHNHLGTCVDLVLVGYASPQYGLYMFSCVWFFLPGSPCACVVDCAIGQIHP